MHSAVDTRYHRRVQIIRNQEPVKQTQKEVDSQKQASCATFRFTHSAKPGLQCLSHSVRLCVQCTKVVYSTRTVHDLRPAIKAHPVILWNDRRSHTLRLDVLQLKVFLGLERQFKFSLICPHQGCVEVRGHHIRGL